MLIIVNRVIADSHLNNHKKETPSELSERVSLIGTLTPEYLQSGMHRPMQ